MIRKIPTVALLIGALAIAGQAEAGGGHGGHGWEGPAVFGAIVGSAIVGSAIINSNRPVYVQQPVYAQPQPVYYGNRLRFITSRHRSMCNNRSITAQPPVYYGPPRGYYGPPRGYYGPPRGYGRW